MKIDLFENAIKYNEKSIENYSIYHTINLSSAKYVFKKHKPMPSTICENTFDFKNILVPKKLLKMYSDNGIYTVIVHPDIVELGQAFGYNLNYFITKNIIEAESLFKSYETQIKSLREEINNFLKNRNLLFRNDKSLAIREISPYQENKDAELQKILYYLNLSLAPSELEFNDYFYTPNNDLIFFEKYKVETLTLYNYEQLQEFLKKLIMKESEYYEDFYLLNFYQKVKEEAIKKLAEFPTEKIYQQEFIMATKVVKSIEGKLDSINRSPLFSKETFSIMYIKLEPFIKKEQGLNNFIDKVLENKLSSVFINDKNIKIF